MPPWAQSAMPVSPWTPDPPFTPFTPDTPDPPLTPQTPQAGEEEWHVSKKCRQSYGNEEWPDSWQGDSEEEVKKSHDPWHSYGNAAKELQVAWQGYSKEGVGRWHDSWHRNGMQRSGNMLVRARGTAIRGT